MLPCTFGGRRLWLWRFLGYDLNGPVYWKLGEIVQRSMTQALEWWSLGSNQFRLASCHWTMLTMWLWNILWHTLATFGIFGYIWDMLGSFGHLVFLTYFDIQPCIFYHAIWWCLTHLAMGLERWWNGDALRCTKPSATWMRVQTSRCELMKSAAWSHGTWKRTEYHHTDE